MSKSIFSILYLSIVMACNAQNESITRIDLAKMESISANENTVVIDVRTPGEVAAGYIKGTDQFIDYNGADFETKIAALDKDKTYVVYCRSGNRSTKALNKMAELGFTKLYELNGGIKAVTNPQSITR